MEIMRAKNRARGIFMHASNTEGLENGARTSMCMLDVCVSVCLSVSVIV